MLGQGIRPILKALEVTKEEKSPGQQWKRLSREAEQIQGPFRAISQWAE